MRRPARRRSTVAAPMAPDSTLTRKAKNLPMFGPGIEITIPLHLWPTYKELYGLEVLGPKQIAWLREHGIPKKDGVLYVRRVPKMKENHE
jgi:hypothetical protein